MFCVLGICWWILDRLTKTYMDGFAIGQTPVRHVLGVFDFELVHNTGAAWGIFSNSTVALGVFSIVMSVAIAVWLFAYRRQDATSLEVVSVALVVAGGLGNAFDRLVYGYVVDFIACTAIDFPVFNVADIGVTVGVVLLCVALLFGGGQRHDDVETISH